MKRLSLLIISLSVIIPALAQRAHIILYCDEGSGMEIVQGIECDDKSEFVLKDSCRVERGRNALNDRLYSERSRSKRYRQLQDSIAAVERFYYNEFPYLILADTAMTQSAYIVHSAIAIRSLARATPRELDSLRTTYAERLPHA